MENTEVIQFDGKYVGMFGITGIEPSFFRTAVNSIERFETANQFYVVLHKNANEPYRQFGVGDFLINKFDRLSKHNDIVSVEFTMCDVIGDDISYKYYLNWNGDDYTNINQTTQITNKGHLAICVCDEEDKDRILSSICSDSTYTLYTQPNCSESIVF